MTTQSGDTSPGGSNSISNSSVRTTRTTEDEEGQVAPHNAFHLGCCSSPEPQEQGFIICKGEKLGSLNRIHLNLLVVFRKSIWISKLIF